VESAAILAGGRAARFAGRDKSRLVVGGRTILERQIAELSRVTSDILIVGRNDQVWPGLSVTDGVAPRLVADIVPDCGPLGGLHTALTTARGDALFVAACDMPYLDASFITYLFGLSAGADAVVPRTNGGYHPLCAVYTRACLDAIARRLGNGRLKMIDLLQDVRTRIVAPDELARFDRDGKLLANVNTPADYADIEPVPDHKL
jgi:molybdopterin-guanine dinucleotide biosynthesis protein A